MIARYAAGLGAIALIGLGACTPQTQTGAALPPAGVSTPAVVATTPGIPMGAPTGTVNPITGQRVGSGVGSSGNAGNNGDAAGNTGGAVH